MTVMNDELLIAWGESGGVRPFNRNHVQPASLDVCMGPHVQRPRSLLSRWFRQLSNMRHGRYFTPKQLEMDLRWHPPEQVDSLTIKQGDFFLLWTLEHTTIPSGYSAQFLLKSTPARYGLGHQLAGWGEDGFSGQWVLEVFNQHPQPLTIKPYEAIGQLILHKMESPANQDYVAKGGQYVNQTPTAQESL